MEWTNWMNETLNQMIGAADFVRTHAVLLVLSFFVLLQWIALQALIIHYSLFRRSLEKPRPDGIRFSVIEKALSFHGDQFDRVYDRLAELKKEIQNVARESLQQSVNSSRALETRTSLEASFASLGEVNLKRRIEAIRTRNPS